MKYAGGTREFQYLTLSLDRYRRKSVSLESPVPKIRNCSGSSSSVRPAAQLDQGSRSKPIRVQPLGFRRKYAETGVAQASGPPTAARSTLMNSEAGIVGITIGLWVS